jgi:hypothetical protein
MVLTKRERVVACAAFGAVALLVADRVLLRPLWKRQEAMRAERDRLVAELEGGRELFERQRQLAPRWRELLAGGLQPDPEKAESQVLHAVRTWSQEAGLTLSSLRPERVRDHDGLREMTFQASATGGMGEVARFLYSLESSRQPVRVSELQLGTRKEGTDDLSLQFRVSALCMGPAEGKTESRKGGGDE